MRTLLYRLVAWLADLTRGGRPFVRWKIALGTALVALGTSCVDGQSARQPAQSNDAPVPEEDEPILCYEPAEPAPPHEQQDNVVLCYTPAVLSPDTVAPPKRQARPEAVKVEEQEDVILCYKIVVEDTLPPPKTDGI